MLLTVNNLHINFTCIPLSFHSRDITNVFANKNNKTLAQTFVHHKYQKLHTRYGHRYLEHSETRLGTFLHNLKSNEDLNYRHFLNKYGDSSYCEFTISNHLTDKGLYCFSVDGDIKYVGRCTDSFKKRINQGYGKIHPKNCFIDGQATNCHLNALVNAHQQQQIEFGVHIMTDKTTEQIKELEKQILASQRFEWNIQTR
jgi:hypothetical protein